MSDDEKLPQPYIAEMLGALYALHLAECKKSGSGACPKEKFYEYYRNAVPDFRHIMGLDSGDRSLNG